MPTPRTSHSRRAPEVPTISPVREGAPWEEIDRRFRDFRESAVRLVEEVNDLLGPNGPRMSPSPKDIRLVRAVFGKWSTEVLVALHTAPAVGFEELRRSLPGISPRVLSLKLKGLEQHGMVRREIIDARPPRVRYTLTDRGWTVAWLADPVLLFLEQSDARESASAHKATPAAEAAPRS
jgi:DNA-binding HxlR family transcriptional regulator